MIANYPYIPVATGNNVAVAGQTIADMISDMVTQIYPKKLTNSVPTVVVGFGGTNDIYFGADAATVYSRTVTYCQNLQAQGFKVIWVTPISRGDWGSGSEAVRQSYTAMCVAGQATFCDRLIDMSQDSVMGQPNSYANTTYFLGDVTHPTIVGCTYLMNKILPVLRSFEIWA